jgi:NAD(P)-dependent dehydrogenase (short-subunit alcohol dehydrogenase family)
MSFLAMGLAEEVAGTGVTSNALWPATAVESFATKNFKVRFLVALHECLNLLHQGVIFASL